MAAKLNNKLNYQPKEEDEALAQDAESTFNKYEEELEINDFPQQARWKVTSKVRPNNPFVLSFVFLIF